MINQHVYTVAASSNTGLQLGHREKLFQLEVLFNQHVYTVAASSNTGLQLGHREKLLQLEVLFCQILILLISKGIMRSKKLTTDFERYVYKKKLCNFNRRGRIGVCDF